MKTHRAARSEKSQTGKPMKTEKEEEKKKSTFVSITHTHLTKNKNKRKPATLAYAARPYTRKKATQMVERQKKKK